MSEWMRGKGLPTGPSLGRSLLALSLCAGAVSIGAQAGVARTRADAVLNVTYVGSTSLQVRLGDGSTVRSGGTVPAGTYQVLVEDDDFATPNFKMSGPGVNITSNLDSSGMGIDHPATFGPLTLQTSSTYTLQDANVGGSSVFTFTTSAAATASGTSNASASSSASGGSSSSTSSGSTSSTTKLVGTLKAAVSTSGRPTLTFNGRAVKTLKTGRYTVTVGDHSKKAGLIVWKLGSHAITLSGNVALGSSSHAVIFSTGKWFFEASMAGPKSYFNVTS
jgi:hypothetical protein